LNQCWSKRRSRFLKIDAQISTNTKLLIKKNNNVSINKSNQQIITKRKEKERMLKAMLLEPKIFLQINEDRRTMKIDDESRLIFLVDNVAQKTQ
jgi:hypothetical protein